LGVSETFPTSPALSEALSFAFTPADAVAKDAGAGKGIDAGVGIAADTVIAGDVTLSLSAVFEPLLGGLDKLKLVFVFLAGPAAFGTVWSILGVCALSAIPPTVLSFFLDVSCKLPGLVTPALLETVGVEDLGIGVCFPLAEATDTDSKLLDAVVSAIGAGDAGAFGIGTCCAETTGGRLLAIVAPDAVAPR
jgi:hypothetical protein